MNNSMNRIMTSKSNSHSFIHLYKYPLIPFQKPLHAQTAQDELLEIINSSSVHMYICVCQNIHSTSFPTFSKFSPSQFPKFLFATPFPNFLPTPKIVTHMPLPPQKIVTPMPPASPCRPQRLSPPIPPQLPSYHPSVVFNLISCGL